MWGSCFLQPPNYYSWAFSWLPPTCQRLPFSQSVWTTDQTSRNVINIHKPRLHHSVVYIILLLLVFSRLRWWVTTTATMSQSVWFVYLFLRIIEVVSLPFSVRLISIIVCKNCVTYVIVCVAYYCYWSFFLIGQNTEKIVISAFRSEFTTTAN